LLHSVCPTGWHIPTDAEWTILISYLGGENVAGGKLKERGTAHWKSPNTGATNESGFTALQGGKRDCNGIFDWIGDYAFWWSSKRNTENVYIQQIDYNKNKVLYVLTDKQCGYICSLFAGLLGYLTI